MISPNDDIFSGVESPVESRRFMVLNNPLGIGGFQPGEFLVGSVSDWLYSWTGVRLQRERLLDGLTPLDLFDKPVFMCIEVDGVAFPLSFCCPV